MAGAPCLARTARYHRKLTIVVTGATDGAGSLCRHYGKQSREVDTIDLEKVSDSLVTSITVPAATPAFEFQHWMSFLDSREQEALTLRFVEEWEYHEIAAAKAIPIGTVQWRVFNAKKKLMPYLKRRDSADGRAA